MAFDQTAMPKTATPMAILQRLTDHWCDNPELDHSSGFLIDVVALKLFVYKAFLRTEGYPEFIIDLMIEAFARKVSNHVADSES